MTAQTKTVKAWLDEHPSVKIHCSWLNQVEIWFSKIQRDLISRGIFTSVADLRRKIMGISQQRSLRLLLSRRSCVPVGTELVEGAGWRERSWMRPGRSAAE